jgi:hypothetical protein
VRVQRALLLAALARKLKPGGMLLLTSDYYFDSAWSNAAFLSAGMMRADGAEIFNGWNRVTPREWVETCAEHGLQPVAGRDDDEPAEGDPTLYLNDAPYQHACIAGVFCDGHRGADSGRGVALSLLTWNTRDASLEALQAHIREAHMLTRLGHRPFICVCDNGSTDGTAEALREVDQQLDIPHEFIFNSSNRGSSVARNQIIDCMRARDADYLLFVDGDIELVPFSSTRQHAHTRRRACTPSTRRRYLLLGTLPSPSTGSSDGTCSTRAFASISRRRSMVRDGAWKTTISPCSCALIASQTIASPGSDICIGRNTHQSACFGNTGSTSTPRTASEGSTSTESGGAALTR